MALAALVAYFTTTSAIQSEIAAMKATEDSHFMELLRRIDLLTTDVREIRNRPAAQSNSSDGR